MFLLLLLLLLLLLVWNFLPALEGVESSILVYHLVLVCCIKVQHLKFFYGYLVSTAAKEVITNTGKLITA
jgi:hypothetical protein